MCDLRHLEKVVFRSKSGRKKAWRTGVFHNSSTAQNALIVTSVLSLWNSVIHNSDSIFSFFLRKERVPYVCESLISYFSFFRFQKLICRKKIDLHSDSVDTKMSFWKFFMKCESPENAR